MKVKSMEFTFDFKRRKINATCLKFKPVKKVMYRVFIAGAKEEDEVFVFYENSEKKTLEWFTLPNDRKEEKAKAIAATLE